jgi:D-glycero-alpha-D-manno-heptose-7-phosphate kinase
MSIKKVILSRACARILDIGGFTDTWFYPKGAVFSFCVDLYSYTRIVENGMNKIRIFAENLEQNTEISNLKKIEYDGNLDLLKAAVKRMNIKKGLDIFVRADAPPGCGFVRADAPPGCGIGTSASVAVSLISALAKYNEMYLDQYEIAQLAHKLETEELNLESGVQDQFAAAYGGINFMEIDYPDVKISSVKINDRRIRELESQFLLLFLSSRSSNEMHRAVIENYKKKDPNTINSFEIMKNCAWEMKRAIKSDLTTIGEIMNKNWDAQKRLHPLMVNASITNAEKISKDNGALGFKCNGAGGGGSATILAEIGHENRIKEKLIEKGFVILPCKLCFKGVHSIIT